MLEAFFQYIRSLTPEQLEGMVRPVSGAERPAASEIDAAFQRGYGCGSHDARVYAERQAKEAERPDTRPFGVPQNAKGVEDWCGILYGYPLDEWGRLYDKLLEHFPDESPGQAATRMDARLALKAERPEMKRANIIRCAREDVGGSYDGWLYDGPVPEHHRNVAKYPVLEIEYRELPPPAPVEPVPVRCVCGSLARLEEPPMSIGEWRVRCDAAYCLNGPAHGNRVDAISSWNKTMARAAGVGRK